jgi:peroxiredoxin
VLTVLVAVLAAAPPLFRPLAAPPGAGTAIAPSFCRTKTELCMTWIDRPKDTSRFRFSRLHNGSWSEPVTIAESARIVAEAIDAPGVQQAADGTLIAHWAEHSGDHHHAQDVLLARSTDEGKTWRNSGVAHDDKTETEHGHVSTVTTPAGVSVFWLDGRETVDGGATALRGGVATQKSVSSQVLDDLVCDCCGTSAAMTTDGPILAYRDRSEGEVRDISVVRSVKGQWTAPRTVARDGWAIPGCPMNGPAVAARARTVAVAWYTYADSQPRVRLAFSKDSGATFGPPVEVDMARGTSMPLGRVGLVLDDDGTAVVSWIASRRDAAELLVRRVASDGKLGEVVGPGSEASGRQIGFARIARDGQDLVVASIGAGGVQLARAPLKRIPAATAVASVSAAPEKSTREQAPDVKVLTLDGAETSLAQLRGKSVLVNFWATWCEPCRQELPLLSKLQATHREKGLVVVGVNIDRGGSAAELKTFAERRKVAFQIWRDPEEQLAAAFGVGTLPASFLIDKTGNIVWSKTGAIESNEAGLAAAVGKLPAPQTP